MLNAGNFICKLSWFISGISTPLLESMELSSINNLRGHNMKLKKNRSHLNVRKFFFSERLVNRWNSLDPDVVCAKSVNVSKKGLDLSLLHI